MDHPLFHRTAEKHCGEWINLPMPLSTNDRCGSRGNCEGVDTSSSSFCHNPCKVELLGGFLTGNIYSTSYTSPLWESLWDIVNQAVWSDGTEMFFIVVEEVGKKQGYKLLDMFSGETLLVVNALLIGKNGKRTIRKKLGSFRGDTRSNIRKRKRCLMWSRMQ